jgi:hypothetical protein
MQGAKIAGAKGTPGRLRNGDSPTDPPPIFYKFPVVSINRRPWAN